MITWLSIGVLSLSSPTPANKGAEHRTQGEQPTATKKPRHDEPEL